MISVSNCINIVDVLKSVNIFDISSYSFDQNRSASPKKFSPPNIKPPWFLKNFQASAKEFFQKFLAPPPFKLGGADAMY